MSASDALERAVEAVLFAAAEPLSVEAIRAYVGDGDIRAALDTLSTRYAGRGIELVRRGDRWLFQTAGISRTCCGETGRRRASSAVRGSRLWRSSPITNL